MNWKKKQEIRLAGLIILMSVTLAALSGCGIAKQTLQSVSVKDTVIVTKERILHDTLTLQKDTIIYKDRVKVEVKWLQGKDVIINAECPPDTITVEKVKIVNQTIRKERMKLEHYLGWGVSLLCFIVIIRELIRKLV